MKTQKSAKIWGWVAGIVILLLVIISFAGGNYLTNYAIARKNGSNSEVVPAKITSNDADFIIHTNQQAYKLKTEKWYKVSERSEESIKSFDGLELKADYVKANVENSNKWAITVHGYCSSRKGMKDVAMEYWERGYNIISPDNRSHGKSEGKYIGMGWLDRKDILCWIDWILQKDPEAQIILHGISMGGATVMMISGEESLPKNVKCIIEDCGYSSVWDIFRDELKYLFHLPAFPLMHSASLISKIKAGYSFTEASSIKQLKKATVPMLFIHGSKDNFVHSEMLDVNYDACASQTKEKLLIEGAGHGQSYEMNPELYFTTVFDFIEKATTAE